MKSVVLLSGGLDSTVLLAGRIFQYGKEQVGAISFDYGQRHVKEMRAACNIASHLEVRHMIVVIESGSQHNINEGIFA